MSEDATAAEGKVPDLQGLADYELARARQFNISITRGDDGDQAPGYTELSHAWANYSTSMPVGAVRATFEAGFRAGWTTRTRFEAEPPDGSVVMADATPAGRTVIFIRDDSLADNLSFFDQGAWFCTGLAAPTSWENIRSQSVVTLLSGEGLRTWPKREDH